LLRQNHKTWSTAHPELPLLFLHHQIHTFSFTQGSWGCRSAVDVNALFHDSMILLLQTHVQTAGIAVFEISFLSLPRTHSNIWDGVTSRSIWIPRLMQHFVHLRQARSEFVQKHNLSNRLHAYIWLLKTYATPAGMYASQNWATPYLQQGKEMDSPLQKRLLAVLKMMLESETPRPHGVSCESVDSWNPYIQLVSRGNAAVQFFD